MTSNPADTLWSHFDTLEDPRLNNHNKRHELKDILVLTILAVICGAESWVDIEAFGHAKADWQGLHSIGLVEAERHVDGKVTLERRFYISSLPGDVVRFARAVRHHWGIESSLHWWLDMAFDEDQNRVRSGYAAENLAVIRHIALNMLRQETSAQVGLKANRKKAGWDERYLTRILTASGF